jgi:hypothetical protein
VLQHWLQKAFVHGRAEVADVGQPMGDDQFAAA